MSADFALQKAIYARLVATDTVVALVPATNIVDRNSRPAPDPSIVIGEGQAVEGERIDRRDQRVFMDLHVWKKEQGMRGVKDIAGAIRAAIHGANLDHLDGYQFGDCRVSTIRYLRDPDGETSHGVVTIEALVCEVAS
jgi:hypothetical protein